MKHIVNDNGSYVSKFYTLNNNKYEIIAEPKVKYLKSREIAPLIYTYSQKSDSSPAKKEWKQIKDEKSFYDGRYFSSNCLTWYLTFRKCKSYGLYEFFASDKRDSIFGSK